MVKSGTFLLKVCQMGNGNDSFRNQFLKSNNGLGKKVYAKQRNNCLFIAFQEVQKELIREINCK